MDYLAAKYDIECQPGDCAVLEDSIMHRGHPVTAGSKMLEKFISPIDATVVSRLEAAGIGILGKAKMDEFGAKGLFEDSETGSGAVSAVADGQASFALCNDYTGDVGRQAAKKGLCYIHPTYGTVPRFGLIPAVQSMDQIGVVCKTPSEGSGVLSIIAGYDEKDGAMYPDTEPKMRSSQFAMRDSDESENRESSGRRLRIGFPVNVLSQIHPDAAAAGVVGIKVDAFEAVKFELDYFDMYTEIMQILCCGELCNNISRYDGVKFGHRAEGYKGLKELYTKSRNEGFGADAKLAAILGSMVLSHGNYLRYYDKAMRIRRLIKESVYFDEYDIIIVPAGIEYGIRLVARCAALPRLCGLPAMTMPLCGGITLIAAANREDVLFTAAEAVEQ